MLIDTSNVQVYLNKELNMIGMTTIALAAMVAMPLMLLTALPVMAAKSTRPAPLHQPSIRK